MIFEPKAKRKTQELVKYIDSLSQKASDRFVEDFGLTEKQLVQKFIADTEEYLVYDEWGVGLENLLENLYEISFPLDEKALLLAKEALTECGMNLEQWRFIGKLKK